VFRIPPGVDPPEINAMHQALRPSALVPLGFAVENVTHNGAIVACFRDASAAMNGSLESSAKSLKSWRARQDSNS
jgi:hypothetical protein